MSNQGRQLFVGVLENDKWTREKLCAYLIKHASNNDNQYVTECEIMSYTEAKFQGKSFAFVTFTDEICVDRCMAKRTQINEEYGITMKRLLPDSTTKCQRLVSTPEIVIRIALSDSLFTEANIRKYFHKYGTILEVKMLEEENTAGICLITFEDFDSSDRVLLDAPHDLNGQILSIHKYSSPEYICSLSQYRFIDEKNAHQIERWYPIVRNFTDLIRPLEILYKTQLALIKYHGNKQISIRNQNLNQAKESLLEFENKSNNLKQNLLQLYRLEEELKQQIVESERKTEANKNDFEYQIQQQREKNQLLEDKIQKLKDKT